MAKTKAATEKEVAKKEETGVLDLATLDQDNIPALLQHVNSKLEEYQSKKDEPKAIDKILPGFNKKISEIKSVEELVKAHSSIVNRKKAYETSAEDLGIDVKKFPFEIEGHASGEWVKNIEHRVKHVKHETQIKQLQQIKDKLEDSLSAEQKRKKNLTDIQGILKDF